MQVLASGAGRSVRVRGPGHDHHLANGGDLEFETLATPKSRSMHDLDLGELVVVRADPVDRLRTETLEAPEFTDRELRDVSNGVKYIRIAAGPQNAQGVDQ
jgi:hypothetical protein